MKKILILSVCILSLLPSCRDSSKNRQDLGIAGVILFLIGDVKAKNSAIYTGDILSHQDIIKVGPKSNCDIQIQDSEPNYTVRVQQNSEFGFLKTQLDGELKYAAFIKEGKASFNIIGPNSNGKTQSVVTPDAKITVKGTKFDLEVKSGRTKVSLYEGSILLSPNISELNGLEPSDLENRQIALMMEKLRKAEIAVNPGSEILLKSESLRKQISAAGMTDALKNRTFEKLNNIEFENMLPKKEELLEQMKINEKTAEQRIKVFSEIVPAELAKAPQNKETNISAVKKRNSKLKYVLASRIAEILEEKPKTVLMRDKSRITGVINEKDGKIYILTPEGEEEIREEEIQELLF